MIENIEAFYGEAKMKTGELYASLRRRNEERWGTDRHRITRTLGSSLRTDLRDLVAELVQNAEDAKAKTVSFHQLENGLLIWNDGKPFDKQDIEKITGLLISTKDARSIGHFGIGFKSVLLLTRRPYILSGPYRFYLEEALDPYPIEGAEEEKLSEFVKKEASNDKTVFWLPFRDNAFEYVERLPSIFCKFGSELLLFLDSLKSIEWLSRSSQKIYLASRTKLHENVQKVTILYQNGAKEEEETWLRLDWRFPISKEVVQSIIQKLREEENQEGIERWKDAADHPQTFSIAIRVKEDQAILIQDGGRIFVGLPTSQITGLQFHLNGRFAVKLDRSGIRLDDPLSEWALEKAKEIVKELPELLKRIGWLKPSIYQIFPKQGEGKEPFLNLVATLRESLINGKYFLGEDGSFHSKDDVFLAHTSIVYNLLGVAELRELTDNPCSCWVHPGLRGGRAREVITSLGVKEISAEQVLAWLGKKDAGWFARRPVGWLQQLYRYLGGLVGSYEEQVYNLPVVLLRNGTCVPPQGAFFPPETFPSKLEQWKELLPIVSEEIIRDTQAKKALHSLGVSDFEIAVIIDYLLQHIYGKEGRKPSPEENRQHIRMVFSLWQEGEIPKAQAEKWKKLPILRSKQGKYVSPCDAYLPPELGGLKEVQDLLSVAGEYPFVAPNYKEKEEDQKVWGDFLQALGVARLPRLRWEKELDTWDWREARNWLNEREPGREPEYSTRGYEGWDWVIDGFKEILSHIKSVPKHPVRWARRLWMVMAEVLEENQKQTFPLITKASFKWHYRFWYQDSITSRWVTLLRETPWLPDESGQLMEPKKLFDHSLKPYLGSGFRYLHPQILTEERKFKELACLLNVHLTAKIDDVLNYLGSLAGKREIEPSQVYRIYRWLAGQKEETEKVRRVFNEKRLILIPGQGWYQAGKVCWYDPTGTIPHLVGHWGDLKDFFVRIVGVNESPDLLHLAHYLLHLGEENKDPDLEQVNKIAYKLWQEWDNLPSELQDTLKQRRCWVGQKGETLGWYKAYDLYLNDNEKIARLFGNRIAWWALKGLEKLAENLNVNPVSSAIPVISPQGDLGLDNSLTGHLGKLWNLVLKFANLEAKKVPEVRKMYSLEVRYKLGLEESEPDFVEAYFDQKEWRLYLTQEASMDPAHPLGDALERAFKKPYLREFIKDLWNIMEDKKRLEKTLQRWEQESGTKLLEDLVLAPEGVESEFPKGREKPETEESPVESPLEGREEEVISPYQGPKSVGILSAGSTPNNQSGKDTISSGDQIPRRPRPDIPLSDQSAEVARRAMEEARRWWEEKHHYQVNDVAGYGLGYDLEVRKGPESFYVEVKGRSEPGLVTMTENEWKVAQKQGDKYFLMIIIMNEGKKWLIQDPVRQLKDHILRREITEIRYDIPRNSWEEVATLMD